MKKFLLKLKLERVLILGLIGFTALNMSTYIQAERRIEAIHRSIESALDQGCELHQKFTAQKQEYTLMLKNFLDKKNHIVFAEYKHIVTKFAQKHISQVIDPMLNDGSIAIKTLLQAYKTDMLGFAKMIQNHTGAKPMQFAAKFKKYLYM